MELQPSVENRLAQIVQVHFVAKKSFLQFSSCFVSESRIVRSFRRLSFGQNR
jgi:hypothetical protein